MMKKTIGVLMVVVLFSVPAISAKASTISDLQAQITSLLEQVQVLQGKVLSLQKNKTERQASEGKELPIVVGEGKNPEVCKVEFSKPLHRGLSDSGTNGEVSKLQKYLKATGDYDHPEITGYFGHVTERALQKWQAKNGIVSTGSYTSTGYGRLGPSTRAHMNRVCDTETPILNRHQDPLVIGKTVRLTGLNLDDVQEIRLDNSSLLDNKIETSANSVSFYMPSSWTGDSCSSGTECAAFIVPISSGTYDLQVVTKDGGVSNTIKVSVRTKDQPVVEVIKSPVLYVPNGDDPVRPGKSVVVRGNKYIQSTQEVVTVGGEYKRIKAVVSIGEWINGGGSDYFLTFTVPYDLQLINPCRISDGAMLCADARILMHGDTLTIWVENKYGTSNKIDLKITTLDEALPQVSE